MRRYVNIRLDPENIMLLNELAKAAGINRSELLNRIFRKMHKEIDILRDSSGALENYVKTITTVESRHLPPL